MPLPDSDIRKAYDLAARAYADAFLEELKHKPSDVELLDQFASTVGLGQRVLDLGCGPGHTTAHLESIGLDPVGVDLSPEMVALASALFPHVIFKVGDFRSLTDHDNSVAGILAFYCIVHLQPDQLPVAFGEMYRVLKPQGALLLSFHIGCQPVDVDSFLDTGASLRFFPFPVAEIQSGLMAAGFADLKIIERPPYETEYPTDRCYILARKFDNAMTG